MILHATEQGSGPPVALLHGLFGRARNFGTVQRGLAARHRVLALDLRNHGESPHASGMEYAELAADVLETLAAQNALPAALLGHSMGGKVAMAVALASPASVTRLLVADIAPVAYAPRNAAIAGALLALPLPPGLTREAADAALAAAVPDPAIRGFLLQNLRPGPDPGWRIGLAEIAAAMPAIEGWPELPASAWYRGPTRFLTGEHSDYVTEVDHVAIRARFPAATFAMIPNAGHWLHADQPAAFLAATASFLTD